MRHFVKHIGHIGIITLLMTGTFVLRGEAKTGNDHDTNKSSTIEKPIFQDKLDQIEESLAKDYITACPGHVLLKFFDKDNNLIYQELMDPIFDPMSKKATKMIRKSERLFVSDNIIYFKQF